MGSTPRYSVPFFQGIGQDLRLGEMKLNCTYAFGLGDLARAQTVAVPPEVLALMGKRGALAARDCGCGAPLWRSLG
jgi:hypothetical protein